MEVESLERAESVISTNESLVLNQLKAVEKSPEEIIKVHSVSLRLALRLCRFALTTVCVCVCVCACVCDVCVGLPQEAQNSFCHGETGSSAGNKRASRLDPSCVVPHFPACLAPAPPEPCASTTPRNSELARFVAEPPLA